MGRKRLKHRKNRHFRKLLTVLFWLNLLVLFFVAWTVNCETKARVSPAYPKITIAALLGQPELTKADYQTLYRQTGLSEITINKLIGQGRQSEIYSAQEQYFREVSVRCEPNTVVSREEYLVDQQGNPASGMHIVDVEDGDILITYCSHTFGWRNGHAALVVDARNRLTLEAQVLGTPSTITSLDHWETYPSFLVLRLTDADEETRKQIAAYAREKLTGIPYQLTAGVLDAAKRWPERSVTSAVSPDLSSGDTADNSQRITASLPTGTQCSHLVWYAYAVYGYDLDSDGGFLVTPYDLAQSPLLEVIQTYGVGEE